MLTEEKIIASNYGFNVDDLFKVGAHFGFSKTRRNPSYKPFIFGTKNGMDIINLEKTIETADKALAFVESLSKEGKQILFVGDKKEAQKLVKDAATKLDMPYVALRWIGGTLTNFAEIKKRIARLEELTTKSNTGELNIYTKKERLLLDKEMEKLEKRFGGVAKMTRLPSALFVVDSGKESAAVYEARKMGMPVIALSGSDCDVTEIDYPIVANDSSIPCIEFFVNKIAEVYKRAKQVIK